MSDPVGRPPTRLHGPCLATALVLMLAGTLYPPLMTRADGRVDHLMAFFLFWAMSAGFVRGVGFLPERAPWRWLWSGRACAGALALAVATRFLHGP